MSFDIWEFELSSSRKECFVKHRTNGNIQCWYMGFGEAAWMVLTKFFSSSSVVINYKSFKQLIS